MPREIVRPSAHSRKEFQAVALGLKLAGKELKKDINGTVRSVLNPIWQKAVYEHAGLTGNKIDSLIFSQGARVAAGNPARAMAGTSRRPLKGGGGLRPDTWARQWEFGTTHQDETSTYTARSSKGKPYEVTRRTRAGMPDRRRAGRVVYPAFAEVMPRMVSLWVSIVAKKFYDAFEQRT